MDFLERFMVVVAMLIVIISMYGIVDAKEHDHIIWAKCITDEDKMLDCKLVNEKIIINGKVSNYKKVLVGEFYNTLVVLVKKNEELK